MNEIIPKSPLTIRPATLGDLAFIDALQKKHSHNVGWMQTKALEGKINLGQIIVAEEVASSSLLVASEEASSASPLATSNKQLATPIGYCMAQDRYLKHDDVGIIYQMNIEPGHQRGLVGASLLKAQFERSAYGCKLYCCWCAQDIEANRFWEAMGFVPLAFRAGSRGKRRVHIFWQRRIRRGDVTTPYWFPSETNSGSIREDRLVLPIRPGTHWRDVMPLVLPEELPVASGQLPVKREKKAIAIPRRSVQFGGPPANIETPPVPEPVVKQPKSKKAKVKNDPRLVAAARELRDRWLEQVNATPLMGGEPGGKYEVARALGVEHQDMRQLAA